MAIETCFIDAMQKAGVNIDLNSNKGGHPIADGKIHRADTVSERGKKHVWYVLHKDKPAYGVFGDFKLGIEDSWRENFAQQNPSQDERNAIIANRQRDIANQRAVYAKMLNDKAAATAKLLLSTKHSGQASPDHAYLKNKNLPVFAGLRQLRHPFTYTIDPEEGEKTAYANSLMVPAFQIVKGKVTLVGLQFINNKGKKRFLRGTPVGGTFHPIGKPPKREDTLFIAEGYATAARIHEATDKRCVAAFNANNLKAVAIAIKEHYPNCRIVIMADNDRLTTEPVNNPGLTKAREAGNVIDAPVLYPTFPDGYDDKTDFDDLAQIKGLAAICKIIDNAFLQKTNPSLDVSSNSADDCSLDMGKLSNENNSYLRTFGSPHFRCLGVDGLHFYYQPFDVAQVVSLSATGHKIENLQVLAPIQWWEQEFPAKNGVDMRAATGTCFRACKLRRKFVPHNAMRGRGAWFEKDIPVFHAGQNLIVNGQYTPISQHDSRYVYDEGEDLDVALDTPLSTKEAQQFLEICRSLRWQNSIAGTLLAGWCIIAPVCGFLKWRPHMWISGEAGSGKSTVMDKIVKVVLGSTAASVLGNTTEAGIRGMLGNDALPIIFDEAEPRDMESKSRLKGIMDYARASASESQGMIYKGTSNQGAKGYRARSMFIFASINMQIDGYADETRVTQLVLKKTSGSLDSDVNKQHYAKLLDAIMHLMTADFSQRMLARTITLLPKLRHYVQIFTEAAVVHFGTQRIGDQIGPMLAGAYLCATSKDITVESALDWMRENDWTDVSAKSATTDNERFLQHITGYMVYHDTPEGGRWTRTIGELITIVHEEPDMVNAPDNMSREKNKKKLAAISALARFGICINMDNVDNAYVEITSTYEGFRNKVLRGTEWASTKYRNILKDIPGAYSGKGNKYFTSGINTPFVGVPINAILHQREPGEDDQS